MSLTLKKVLVVEDNEQHLAEAVKLLEAAGIEVMTAKTAFDAQRLLNTDFKRSIDAVMTDLYMPYKEGASSADQPCGLVVAAVASQRNIPLVICTAGWHHGSKYGWVCELLQNANLQWSMVESGTSRAPEDEAPTKNWAEALQRLRRQIERRNEKQEQTS